MILDLYNVGINIYIYIQNVLWFCSPLPLLEVLYINQAGRTFLRAFEKATYDHSVAKGQLRQVAITWLRERLIILDLFPVVFFF